MKQKNATGLETRNVDALECVKGHEEVQIDPETIVTIQAMVDDSQKRLEEIMAPKRSREEIKDLIATATISSLMIWLSCELGHRPTPFSPPEHPYLSTICMGLGIFSPIIFVVRRKLMSLKIDKLKTLRDQYNYFSTSEKSELTGFLRAKNHFQNGEGKEILNSLDKYIQQYKELKRLSGEKFHDLLESSGLQRQIEALLIRVENYRRIVEISTQLETEIQRVLREGVGSPSEADLLGLLNEIDPLGDQGSTPTEACELVGKVTVQKAAQNDASIARIEQILQLVDRYEACPTSPLETTSSQSGQVPFTKSATIARLSTASYAENTDNKKTAGLSR